MKNVEELIARSRDRGIKLWVSEGVLRYRAPRAAISTELRAELQANKVSIIDALSGPRYEYAPEVLEVEIPEPFAALWGQVQTGIIGTGYTNVTNMLCRFKCPINVEALEQALTWMVQRHNALRCRLSDDERGMRLVFDRTPKLVSMDLSDCDASEVESVLTKAAQEIFWKPFSSDECLFKPFMFKLPSSELAIGFVVHHFIVDAWSFALIPRYWMQGYAMQLGEHPEGAKPQEYLQCSDYLRGVANWSKTLNFRRRLGYWKEALGGAVPSRLPPDLLVEPDQRSFHRAQHIQIAFERVEQLSVLAASIEVTLSDVILAGVVIALQSELNASDICVRHAWHGRDESKLVDMIGFPADMVFLRVRLNTASCLPEVARQIHRVALDAVENYVPSYYIDKLLTEAGATAFVQTNFQFRDDLGDHTREVRAASSFVKGIRVPELHRPFTTPRKLQAHDINLSLVDGSVWGDVVYLESVYDDETISRFIQRFHEALEVPIAAREYA
ncbi:MAG: condensation domain-containing protein [Pseudomonadota bacterium]